ncbi:MAG: hypothetical protein QME79_14625 [Bacillota bacterium]|nr:hypothetical protein [Bacillota bacterium]
MFWYKVPAVGSGEMDDPRRPDLPEGISWVGNGDGKHYLVAIAEEVPGVTPLTPEEARTEAAALGLDPAMLDSWALGR